MTLLGLPLGQLASMLSLVPAELILGAAVLVLFVIIALIIFMGYFKIIRDIAYFAYPNARVKAIGNPYVRAADVYGFLESKSVSEIISRITDRGYDIEISSESKIEDIERSLDIVHYKACEKTVQMVPASARPFFKAYLMVLEAEQLKTAIRSKNAGVPPEEIKNILIPVGNITQTLVDKMIEADSVGNIILILEDTPYARPLSSARSHYEGKSVLPLELALDKFVFQQLHKSRLKLDASISRPISRFIGTYADITNIKTILRAKKEGVEAGMVQKYILAGGQKLSEAWLKQIFGHRNVMGVITQFEGTKYMPFIEKAIPEYEKTRSIYPFEVVLDRFLLHMVFALAREYQVTVGPVLKFVVAKRYEIRNIRAALHGIREHLSPEIIKETMICEEGI